MDTSFNRRIDQFIYLDFQRHQGVLTLQVKFMKIFQFLYREELRGLATLTTVAKESGGRWKVRLT